ncbi:ArsR/SmtB family transcription factor [Euzebya tangerina]|uniref:ArsR/SmtB family transcription factor n=1 Tax=Euzebya tangerina TaxID=591198 RepID=UPI000E30B467|nr:metalloregulator ArsR/SmtB family transcription factor [Euzebya tangerina]
MLDYELDGGFKALADPTRRTILSRLTRGPASVGELAAPFDMTLSAVMQHLTVLEDAGLISSQKVGRTRTCALVADRVRGLEGWLADQRTSWERRLDGLEDLLAEPTAGSRPDALPSDRTTEEETNR